MQETKRITANDAALIQRNLVGAALRVARHDTGIAALVAAAETNPALRSLSRAVRELREQAQPMMACGTDVVSVAA